MPKLDAPELSHHDLSLKTPLLSANGEGAEEKSDGENFDPLVTILASFHAIPEGQRKALFESFREAAESEDLRQLLDAISDWAATAEMYADTSLRTEFVTAQAGRK